MTITAERIIQQDTEKEVGLFADLMEDVDGLPHMPEAYVPYDREITRAEVKDAANAVFIVWLKAQLSGRPTYVDTTVTGPRACESPEYIDLFFPDWAIADDFRI